MKNIISFVRSRLVGPGKSVPKRIHDVFNTGYKKKAMLSYITSPFEYPHLFRRHTNSLEAKFWANEIHRRGFSVDVFNFNDIDPITNLTDYEFYFGFGVPFEHAMTMREDQDTTFIFYGTGCHHTFSDRETIKRKINFNKKYGRWPVTGGREIGFSWPIQMLSSDYYVALGNNFVAETYRKNILMGGVFQLRAFYLNDPATIKLKTFTEKSRENLLWFGANGAIHKGLINTIESLRHVPNVTLHIAGLADRERRGLELDNLFADLKDRVIYHGVVDVASESFEDLVDGCGIVIYPSASEGGAVSVLTAVANGGGVPIVTRATGVDMQDCGIIIESDAVEKIVSAIRKVLDMPVAEYVALANSAQRYFANHYTPKHYQEALTRIFDEIGVG